MIDAVEPSAGLVVDTDVVSYVFRGDSRSAGFAPILNNRTLVISFMTVAELDRWAISRDLGSRPHSDARALLTPLRRATI
jgi:predicted nucleic acid-binding protein